MELPSAYGIELSGFIDLIRLISSSSPDRPSTVFKWTDDSKLFYYGSFAIFPGYFDYKGLPVMFYIKSKTSLENEALRKNIIYRIRTGSIKVHSIDIET